MTWQRSGLGTNGWPARSARGFRFEGINSGTLLLEYQLHHTQFDSIFQSLTVDFDSLPSFATPEPANNLFLGYRPWPSLSKVFYHPTIEYVSLRLKVGVTPELTHYQERDRWSYQKGPVFERGATGKYSTFAIQAVSQ
jgi:hypothetical protein